MEAGTSLEDSRNSVSDLISTWLDHVGVLVLDVFTSIFIKSNSSRPAVVKKESFKVFRLTRIPQSRRPHTGCR